MFENKILESNFEAAVEAFNRCDPSDLIKLGAPDDEYFFEAAYLANCITDQVTYELLQGAVYGLLLRSFGEDERNADKADRIASMLADKWIDLGHELTPVEQLIKLAAHLDALMSERDKTEQKYGFGVALHFIGKFSLL